MTLFTFFSQFILILFMTCSLRHVHNLFMTCSQVAHYLFTFLHLYKFTWIILLTLLYLTYFPYPLHYFTLTLTNLLTIFALNYFTLGEASLKKNWKIWGKFPIRLSPPPPQIIQKFLNFRKFWKLPTPPLDFQKSQIEIGNFRLFFFNPPPPFGNFSQIFPFFFSDGSP